MQVKRDEVHLVPLRTNADPELIESVREHGILIPPLLLKLSDETKRKLKTEKDFLCLDGWSRFQGVEKDEAVDCEIISEAKLCEKLVPELQHTGLPGLPIPELAKIFTLRLHAHRRPLPREAYASTARRLMEKGASLRGAARLLGIPKSTLERWLEASGRNLEDEDVSPIIKDVKKCGLCGGKTGNPKPLYFHEECRQEAIRILTGYRAERERFRRLSPAE